ncbi:GNAT family N-acetyltransferase [Brachybacterium sp. AOP3-A1-3]|uniref:GNAT family N-acetyltransferase n=1 Tax=Brachybacterium sp. AOP3-A1-3 TaxID=3457699 RepID=UPI004034B17C
MGELARLQRRRHPGRSDHRRRQGVAAGRLVPGRHGPAGPRAAGRARLGARPRRAGPGLGTEFAAALLDLAVDGLGVRRVEASCFAENFASRRVMEKIGMRCEGVFVEESLHRSGRWLDGMSFAILAREHRAHRA